MHGNLGAEVTRSVIGTAIEVHRQLGPRLLESACEKCLACELRERRINYAQQVPLPLIYKGIDLDRRYMMDFVVADQLVVELKSADQIILIPEAQILTCLRFTGHQPRLLINFNNVLLKHGPRRYARSSAPSASLR